jgi:hypothetical protein
LVHPLLLIPWLDFAIRRLLSKIDQSRSLELIIHFVLVILRFASVIPFLLETKPYLYCSASVRLRMDQNQPHSVSAIHHFGLSQCRSDLAIHTSSFVSYSEFQFLRLLELMSALQHHLRVIPLFVHCLSDLSSFPPRGEVQSVFYPSVFPSSIPHLSSASAVPLLHFVFEALITFYRPPFSSSYLSRMPELLGSGCGARNTSSRGCGGPRYVFHLLLSDVDHKLAIVHCIFLTLALSGEDR